MPGRTRADKGSSGSRKADGLPIPESVVSAAIFRKFQELIYNETGIWLGRTKTGLLSGRLFRRLRSLGVSCLEEYYELVALTDQVEERARMIDAITTNETRFFREPRQFDFLVQQVFPRWSAEAAQRLRPKRIRIWSAGCSSGEEPYTLAMLLAQYLPASSGWDARLLATDISNRVLERARKGIYDVERSADIPKSLLHTFMLRGFADQQGRMKVKTDIQEMIEFRRLNLNQHPYAVESSFDAILCRNVLIYFNADSRQRAVSNMVNHLADGGHLFVGHAENLTRLSADLRSVEPTIYIKKTSSVPSVKGEGDLPAPANEAERRKAIGASASR